MNAVANAGLDDEDQGGIWFEDGILDIDSSNNNGDEGEDIVSDIPNRDICSHGEFRIKVERDEEDNFEEVTTDEHFSTDEPKHNILIQSNLPVIKKEYVEFEESSIKVVSVESVRPSKVTKTFDYRHEVGELVWAKMSGYPSWPALIVTDPKTQLFVKQKTVPKKKGHSGTALHVLFLNYNDQVAWIPATSISKYCTKKVNSKTMKKDGGKMRRAMAIADSLVDLSCEDRIEQFVQMQGRRQSKEKEVNYLVMYPKLLLEPVVKVQRFESAIMQSFRKR